MPIWVTFHTYGRKMKSGRIIQVSEGFIFRPEECLRVLMLGLDPFNGCVMLIGRQAPCDTDKLL